MVSGVHAPAGTKRPLQHANSHCDEKVERILTRIFHNGACATFDGQDSSNLEDDIYSELAQLPIDPKFHLPFGAVQPDS